MTRTLFDTKNLSDVRCGNASCEDIVITLLAEIEGLKNLEEKGIYASMVLHFLLNHEKFLQDILKFIDDFSGKSYISLLVNRPKKLIAPPNKGKINLKTCFATVLVELLYNRLDFACFMIFNTIDVEKWNADKLTIGGKKSAAYTHFVKQLITFRNYFSTEKSNGLIISFNNVVSNAIKKTKENKETVPKISRSEKEHREFTDRESFKYTPVWYS